MTSTAVTTTNGKSQADIMAIINAGKNPYDDILKDDRQFFGDYLKINGNTGVIEYGEDETELDAPFEAYLNVPTIRYGWKCWKDSEVVNEIADLALNADQIPKRENELPDHGPYDDDDGWIDFYEIHLITATEKPEDEVKITYQIAAAAAKSQLKKMLRTYWKNVSQQIGEDGLPRIPIIEVSLDSYMSKDKKRGKKYFPVFEIVDWVDFSELGAEFEMGADDENDEGNYEDEPSSKSETKSDDKDEDVTDIDPETGDAIDEGSKDAGEEKPRGRGPGRGGRGRGGAKAATADEGPDDTSEEKPTSGRGRGRGRS